MYLDVIVVFAREPHGQLAFGLGAAIPQPTHFRGELQVLDRQGTAGGGWRAHHVKTQEDGKCRGWGGVGEEIETKGNGGKVIKAKTRLRNIGN